MENDKAGFRFVPGQARAHPKAPHSQVALASAVYFLIANVQVIGIDFGFVGRRPVNHADGEVSQDAIEVDLGRTNQLLPDAAAVFKLRQVAGGLL